jgi:O-antigen/teichoic acid export membrane protein
MLAGDTAVVVATAVIQAVLRLVSTAILTRLLAPEAFGVVGIITSFAVTFGLLSDLGIGAYVIRHEKELDRDLLDEMWTLKMIRSIALALGMAASAVPIASFLGKPELALVFAFAGTTFLLDGLTSMSLITALRSRKVRLISTIDVLVQVVGLVSSVLLTVLYPNYWAIMLSGAAAQIVKVILSYIWFPDSGHRWRLSKSRANDLWRFSRFITSSTILTLAISQFDKIVIAKLFPLDVLGLYVIASSVAVAPRSVADLYSARVLFPAYSNSNRLRPAELKETYYSHRMNANVLYNFLVGGLIACSPAIVRIIYTSHYGLVAVYMQIMLISTLLEMSNRATNDVMIARGESWFTLSANFVRIIFIATFGPIAYLFAGVIGIVWTVGSLELAVQIYSWIILGKRGLLGWRSEFILLLAAGLGVSLGYVVNGATITLLSGVLLRG